VAFLALFDLDNTLLDREKAFALWTKWFVEAHGLREDALPTIERLDADGYDPREQFFAELRKEQGIAISIDELLADYYVEYPSKYAVEPGVIDSVRSLRVAGFKVGVPRTPVGRVTPSTAPVGTVGQCVLLLVSVATLVADIVHSKSVYLIVGSIASIGLWTSLLVGDYRARRQRLRSTSERP
jgi:hypothetical protein